MIFSFTSRAWAEYTYWQATDPKMVERINDLLKNVGRSPFSGIGKPEPLKNEFKGFWSRRIDSQHRLVYRATKDTVLIVQCRFHY